MRFGSFEGWNYMIMTQLKGELLINIWEQLTPDEKLDLCQDLGRTIKEFHQVPLEDFKYIQQDWTQFIEGQYQNCLAYHQGMGLNEILLEDLDVYLNEEFLDKKPAKRLLTGEYTPFNLLLNQDKGKWKLTGVIDFADCFIGDGDYDLLGPILFMFNCNQTLVCRFLESYGYSRDLVSSRLQKKLMTYAILHRYSDINFFVSQRDEAKEANNFQELAEVLFPLEFKN